MPDLDTRGQFSISTDPARLDLDAIHAFLSRAYWSPNIPRETVARALANSFIFGMYDGDRQIGLIRVITDRATFAYLKDMYILEEYRGQGLAKWLIGTVIAHPELQRVRSWNLSTWDAHSLYAQFGFKPLPTPEHQMVRRAFDSYPTLATEEAEQG